MESVRRNIERFFGFNHFRDDISKDGAKSTLLLGKFVLGLVNFWPEDASKYATVSFYAICGIYVCLQTSLVVDLVGSTEGVLSLARTVFKLELGMQIITKMNIVYSRSSQFAKIIKTIRYEFWPSNILSKSIDGEIRSETRRYLKVFLMPYIGAMLFLTQIVTTPFFNGTRTLPYDSWYPFNWSRTPTYEILYIFQAYVTVFVNGNIVCGTDMLYYSICSNCMTQYRLLCNAIKEIGRGRERELNHRLMGIPGVSYEPVVDREYEDERKLLVICIKHHQKLLDICSQLNQFCKYGHFVQLVSSLIGLGTVCYLMSTEKSATDQSLLLPFFVAHVAQLLLYCSISNELAHWSEQLSIDAFQCAWYNQKYKDIRQCLSIMIKRCQQPVIMTALGMVELSYASFVLVMRYTFSFYTFLDNFTEK